MLNSLKGLLSRKNDVPSPTVISLGQVWVDIMMDIDAIPQPGGFAVANHTMPSVGGSFRVMQAAGLGRRPSTQASSATGRGRH